MLVHFRRLKPFSEQDHIILCWGQVPLSQLCDGMTWHSVTLQISMRYPYRPCLAPLAPRYLHDILVLATTSTLVFTHEVAIISLCNIELLISVSWGHPVGLFVFVAEFPDMTTPRCLFLAVVHSCHPLPCRLSREISLIQKTMMITFRQLVKVSVVFYLFWLTASNALIN